MKIVNMKISDIHPYENNPRINDGAVDAVAASIKEFGWRAPIVVDKDHVIITGHTRLKAAIKLGMTEVPVHMATDLSPEQAQAYRIADNKTAEIAEWDYSLLPVEIKELQENGFDMALLGFSTEELEQILNKSEDDVVADGETDPDAVPETPEAPASKSGEMYKLGDHLLLCGDATDSAAVDRLMAGSNAALWLTDPPYNVTYTGKTSDALTIENDSMSDEKFRDFLKNSFGNVKKHLIPGGSFYIFHADLEGYNFRGALRDVELKLRQCLIWNKNTMVLGRSPFQWKHETCQPEGTMIRIPNGEIAIENIVPGDKVVSFDTYSGAVKGFRNGVNVSAVAKRKYQSAMYKIEVDGKCTKATDNHIFSVRFNQDTAKKYCTYLMRRGEWWRVGRTVTYEARGFGLKGRFRQEHAEEAWLLETFNSAIEAECAEQMISTKYGIPFTHWESTLGVRKYNRHNSRSENNIKWIYDHLDLAKMADDAKRLLKDYGRNIDYPLLDVTNIRNRFSRRVTTKIRACNVMADLMEVPVPLRGYADFSTFKWQKINSVSSFPFDGYVYSLQVDKWKHYIADGIVVHNCLFGWNEGAAHAWYNDRCQTTVLDFKRPSRSEDHPTMKPVDMLVYLVKNSSRRGEIVVDTFGGSGSTLMACEQTGRVCRMMELDPKYCDVIRRRWAEFMFGEGCDWAAKTPACEA